MLTLRSVTALALCIALGGCYNAAHHALAQSVQGTFKELHIGASLNAEREQSRELLKQELEVVERQQQANRDLALADAINSDWATFRESIHDRAKELFGNRITLADLDPAADAIEEWNEQREELKRREKQLMEELSLEVLCPLSPHMTRPSDDAGKTLLLAYETACRQTLEIMKKVPVTGGDLAEIRDRIRTQEDEIRKWREKSGVARQSFAAAVREYERMTASGTSAGALAKQRTAIEAALRQMHDAGPIGELDEIDARQFRIQALITERQQTDTPREGPETAAEIAAGPVLTLALIRSRQGLALLELEAQRLRSEREAAAASRQSADTRLKLFHAAQESLFEGALRLSEASAAVEQASSLQGKPTPAALPADKPRREPAAPEAPAPAVASKCVDASLPVAQNFAQSTGPCKVAIAKALMGYSGLWTVGRIPAAQARWLALGIVHEQAIDESIATLEQWETVLATPISQLVTYHAAGIKPDALAQLMFQAAQALSVAAIAVSVSVP